MTLDEDARNFDCPRRKAEYIGDDECVEVTPAVVRIRKVHLAAVDRAKSRNRAKA